MKIDIPFKVIHEDGAVQQGRVRFTDFVACELHFGKRIGRCYEDSGMTCDLWLAWKALSRDGEGRPFEDWLGGVTEYEDLSEQVEEGEGLGEAPPAPAP